MQVDTKTYPYMVSIPYRAGDTITGWNIVCADCVEKYGLPGDKYVTHATADFMNFHFKNEKDAIVFNLATL